jgi:hypothetical protein
MPFSVATAAVPYSFFSSDLEAKNRDLVALYTALKDVVEFGDKMPQDKLIEFAARALMNVPGEACTFEEDPEYFIG